MTADDGGEPDGRIPSTLAGPIQHPYLRSEATSLPRRALLFGGLSLALALFVWLVAPSFFTAWPGISSSLLLFPAFLLLYYRGLRKASLGVGVLLLALWSIDVVTQLRGARPVEAGTVFIVAFAGGGMSVMAWLAWVVHQQRMHELAQSLAVNPDTQLPRSWVFEWYVEKAEEAASRGEPVSLILLDLEPFDDAGQKLEPSAWQWFDRKLAELLRLETRAEDVVGERGEGVYGVLLRGESPKDAARAVRRLARLARSLQSDAGHTAQVSAGLATYEAAHEADRALLEAAERALHSARYGGGNQTVVFGSERYEQVAD